MRTWNVPFITFLSGCNTIKVNDRVELEIVKEKCRDIGLDIHLDWDYLSTCHDFKGYVCLEYQNGKGTSFYLDEQDSINWYEEPPITIAELN